MLNWEALGSAAETLAALGALVTIAYLAVQIRQSNQIAQSAATNAVQDKYNEFHMLVLSNPDIAELSARLTNPTFIAESGAEAQQVDCFVNLFFNIYLGIQIAYDRGQIDKDLFEIYRKDVSVALARWPASVPYFIELLNRYPTAKEYLIFKAIVPPDV